MEDILGGLPSMVSPDRVGGEVFSSMFELHAAVLGVTCGVLVVLLFPHGREDVGLFLLLLVSLTALGNLPYERTGRALTFMRSEPWYFLSALAIAPGLYTCRAWVVHDATEHYNETATVDPAPADD